MTGKKYFINYQQIVTNELCGDETLAVEHIAYIAESQLSESGVELNAEERIESKKVETAENINDLR